MINRRTGRTLGLAVAATLALAACGDDAFGPEPRDVEFAASLGIDLETMTETSSGLFFKDDIEGTGDPVALLDTVSLSYTGWLVNGEEFDSGMFPATLGETGLIPGFTEGIVGMRVGGTRTLVIPADLAYGSAGQGSIPGNAVLVFEIMLVSILTA